MAHSKKKNNHNSKESVKEKLKQKKKESKILLKEKKARLIVKNLPFKATEENLREYFEQYGDINNIELLKKPNGTLVGCGFIQFKLVQKASKARHYTNGKQFMGRELIVDFAKPKNKYKKEVIKSENEESQIKDEHVKEDAVNNKSTKEDDNGNVEDKNESDEQSEDEANNSEASDGSEQYNEVLSEHKPHMSNDVTEGKTVFVKNIPFHATNDDLKSCMSQFGRVYYALICIDKLTEHSKGTGFVKFVNKEDAEKALTAGTELTLMGNILDCHAALGRAEIQTRAQEKNLKQPKDSRNLYLVKEGVILAGTKSAEGVSASDMAKRLQIEQYKTQMLRNLNMFVSKERLVVHNLPASWDDKKFGMLLKKYGGPGAIVKEARIMRDMKIIDANGMGKSKEYGFVTFTKHEHALAALRNLNNNPNIFTSSRRPIITFSIENKKMVNARIKRLEKSKLNNPLNKKNKSVHNKSTKLNKDRNYSKSEKNEDDSNEIKPFSGISAKPGTIQKMRSRYKLTTQAQLHHQNLKKEKKRRKNMKKTLTEKRQDFIKQPRQKIKKVNETDNFSKLVNEYKKKIVKAAAPTKTKWFE